jgi:alkanesulfonate monooxygenase SsuD/methylene tetrahydromethanopterin reductase-like flavin-dependent oxidoreductase (luciferase family)
MEFGILFTSHPNTEAEPYPHRDVHARVTRQVVRADELGYDYAWVAEHHFSNEYGIMPDVFVYAAYLAALTKRIKIGTAVVTLPLANPLRVAENTAFLDILSNGRFALGLGSGYRKYEFDGFGADFEARRDVQEEALPLLITTSASTTTAIISVSRLTAPTSCFRMRCNSRIRRSFWPAPPSVRSAPRPAWDLA